MFNRHLIKWLLLSSVFLAMCPALAQTTYTDNFTGQKAQLQWIALNDACLTAGSESSPSSPSNPIIPSCASKGISVEANETIDHQGALLLTPAENDQTGAILSGFPPFPLSQGIQITFTTYTFGGDSGGTAGNGADGIVFFLTSAEDADGTEHAPPTKTGAEGGSMGYDCSNDNGVYDGIANGYLGLGIDEFGNFLNSGDNGSTGIYNSNNQEYGTDTHGSNQWENNVNGGIGPGSGPQYQPERIGLRGAGNTNWAWLQEQNSDYYSGSSNASDVQWACKHGEYVSGVTYVKHYYNHGRDYYTTREYTYNDIPFNYNAIPGGYAVLPDDEPIANNSKQATRNPTAQTNPNNIAWPITYRLKISPSGLLNFSYSYNNGAFQPVLVNANVTAFNGPLPKSLRFGFSAGTGGDNNVHEITCFKAAPLQSNSSAGANTQKGKKVTGQTQFFLAAYSSDNWWGSLVADPLSIANDGTLSVSTVANWDAKCDLTGGPCGTMGTDANGNPIYPVTKQAPSTRVLLTWNSGGVPLEWSDLSTAEQTALNTSAGGTVDDEGDTRVEWLRGVRSVEQLQNPPGQLRARTYVLGDIINSSPTFVGAPVPGTEPNVFHDKLYPEATVPEDAGGATTFGTFAATNASRENVVYVGSNDGFVHGFRAGSYQKNNSGVYAYDDSTNDGHEVIGYMPYGVLMHKAVNLADPLYKHDYLVDATPAAGDVFYSGTWHTWLIGGVGSDGKEIYALNVTNPSVFSQANASSLVMGDWNSTTLTHLGNTVGTPIFQRMHNGDWAFIFGSGLGSDMSAGVYIGLINPANGSVTFRFLDTGETSDGIAYVSAVDLDGDGIADYLYAGDTQGNVWRFDVTSNDPSDWKVSTFGHSGPTPLFVAKDASGTRQPITTAITVLAVQTGSVTRDMLYFGTGQQIQQTGMSGRQYAKGQQTFYGIWDWNMNAWNNLSPVHYASLTGQQTIGRNNLLAQSVVSHTVGSTDNGVKGYRTLSTQNIVCWEGNAASDACPTSNQYGWMFDLPGKGPTTGDNAGENEQIIYSPTFIGGAVIVNTAIPPVISAYQCNPGLQSGWTMAFNPKTGGGLKEGFFPGADGSFGGGGGSGGGGGDSTATVSGVQQNGVGTPTVVQYGGKSYMVTQTVTGAATLLPINPQSENNPARVSWRELVNP